MHSNTNNTAVVFIYYFKDLWFKMQKTWSEMKSDELDFKVARATGRNVVCFKGILILVKYFLAAGWS